MRAFRVVWLCALSFLSLFAEVQGAPPIRIMPVGDSITDGAIFDSPDGTGGYRGPLYNLVTSAGYHVDYIGSHTNNSELLVEKEHDGHGGWRIDQIDAKMGGWLTNLEDPDVVLLLIGTNDFGQNFSVTTAINRLDNLILKIAILRPFAHVIVANLLERNESQNANTNIQTYFNPYVQQRVNAHAAAGRRVTFLDLRSAVPISDMPDQLHPNQTGYNKMAAAWFAAIQAVIGPKGDGHPPKIVRARGLADRTHVEVKFSKPVAESAANAANFSLSGGLTVESATLDATKRIVTLTTSEFAPSATYTVSVSNVEDRVAPPNTIAANSTATFSAATPRGYLHHVPESVDYTLAYSLDVPLTANYLAASPSYAVDNRHGIGPFSRVAYYVELQSATGALQYLWVSMDPFTNDVSQIGVPTLSSGAIFQKGVTNMNVVSNVPGIAQGEGLAGHMEFWPTDYSQPNAASVPGASGSTFDFGDSRSASGTYGSMQIHNPAAKQTLFAFNNWGGSGTTADVDIGIGNQSSDHPDWTFAANAGRYAVRSIQVLVKTTGDVTSPILESARAISGGTTVAVSFSEPLAAGSIDAANFSLGDGVIVLGAELAANQRQVILTTTALPAEALTLTVSGVRDSSPHANLLAPNSTLTFQPISLPPEISTNVGAPANGYQLVYSLNIPVTGNLNALDASAYSWNESAANSPFTRVAYYFELQKSGQPPQFVWVSMNAFTADRRKIAVPTVASGAFFQQNLANLEIVSNVPGVATGSVPTGNIEFWPSNYTNARAAASPANASDAIMDFGDSGGSLSAGWGSMQIHNSAAGQTLFAINRFGTDGQVLEMGIGNNPSASSNNSGGQKDWTFTGNSGTYSRRVLHVFVDSGTQDSTPPSLIGARGSTTLDRLVVSFSEPVADTAAAVENFSIDGLTVTDARLLDGKTEIALSTSPQTAGAVYTVTATGICDRSAAGHLILPGASVTFAAFAPPPILANLPEGGYELVQHLAIPSASGRWNVNRIPYSVDESRYGGKVFDRVAYLLELDGKWAYASFDTFTNSLAKVGVPSVATWTLPVQRRVENMTVASNVPGIVTGSGIETGNIEFWSGNYSAANAIGIPNASASALDFGDQMITGGFGTMQVHNHGASQTIMAYNHWGSNVATSDLGLGNNPNAGAAGTGGSQGLDWTFAANAATYTSRNLYVLVRPGGVPSGPAPQLLSQPTSRALEYGGGTTLSVSVAAHEGGPVTYQWRRNGEILAGETRSWLEIADFTAGKAGEYDVVVTGEDGNNVTSRPATVARSNQKPIFGGFAFTVHRGDAVSFSRNQILAKTSDADGDSVSIAAVTPTSAQGGSVVLGADFVSYQSPSGFRGGDSFGITFDDGFGGQVLGAVQVAVTAAEIDERGRPSLAMDAANGEVDLVFHGLGQQPHVIERSTGLVGWTLLQLKSPGDDGILPFSDPNPPSGKAFYRARLP